MPWTYEPPKNVSKEHFWLQHLARSYLRHNHYCSCVGTEVPLQMLPANYSLPVSLEVREAAKYHLQQESLDVMAVGSRYSIAGRPERMERDERVECVSIGIEVKVSRSDFKSGFHARCCNFNYVLAPAGMIKREEMPEGCGLLSGDRNGWAIRIVKRAAELKEPAFSIDTAIFAIAVALTTEYANRMRNTELSRVTWLEEPSPKPRELPYQNE